MRRSLLIVGLLLGALQANGTTPGKAEPKPLATNAEVDAAIARLKNPAARLSALRQLIATGSIKLYQVGSVIFCYGDATQDRLAERAAQAARDADDLPTVSAALDSLDWDLQLYGIWFSGITDPQRFPDRAVLIPKVKKLAVSGDAGIREQAVELLKQLPGFADFLAERAREETSLGVIMRIVYGSNGAGYNSAMNEAALRLLKLGRTGASRRSRLYRL